MSDNKFHNLGLSYYGWDFQDLGRYEITGDKKDLGAFKTPSLINVGRSQPYFHTGGFGNLFMAMHMGYNSAFPVHTPKGKENDELLPVTDPLIQKLNLTRGEIEALEAFLKTL